MAKKSKRKTAADPVTWYAENVIDGTIIAGRLVKMACERHMEDLKRKDFVWDVTAALYVIGFFGDILKLNGGEFEGKPFILAPWEVFIIGSIFGWLRPNGYRRFTWAYIEIGKGAGKSPLAGGIGIFMLVGDKEPRAEIYSCGADKEQAKVLFRDAVAMRNLSDRLRLRLQTSGTGENVWNLADHKLGGWFRPWSKENRGKQGFRPHCGLVDELHEHRDGTIVNAIQEGFKGRRQPLRFEITNSGWDRKTVCWKHHERAVKMLKGILKNDRLFAYICTLDPCQTHIDAGLDQPAEDCKNCDDFHDEKVWPKTNPNLPISPKIDYLRDQVRDADEMPDIRNKNLRLNFCIWTQALTRYVPANHWRACGGAIDLAALKGRPCIGGLDLSSGIDLTALVLVFPPPDVPMKPLKVKTEDGVEQTLWVIDTENLKEPFVALCWFWIPEENMQARVDRDQVPYDEWKRLGLIETTPGNWIDYAYIRSRVVSLSEIYKIQQIGYDPWKATETAQKLDKTYGFQMVEVRQGYQSLSEATQTMLGLVMRHKLRHGGNAVLTWMADNLVVEKDHNENVKPDKEHSTEKIDGLSALITALSVMIRMPGPARSVYEDRGVLRV